MRNEEDTNVVDRIPGRTGFKDLRVPYVPSMPSNGKVNKYTNVEEKLPKKSILS